MTVDQALTIYAREHAPHVADPARIGYALDRLLDFWEGRPISDIKGETCRLYAKTRGVMQSTVRRELGALRAALNYCAREGYLISAPMVTLPEKEPPKERWLTTTEAAYLLKAARRVQKAEQHLPRFILTCLYTGTRKEAALALRIDQPSTHGGWINTSTGILYRQPVGKAQTKKRQPEARLPRQFLAHVRRWSRMGCRFVVETSSGNRVGDVRKAFRSACLAAEGLAMADGLRIDLSDVTPHTLRHTAITWALQRGATIWDAAGYFGAGPETIERVYGHHSPDHQKSAVSAMERI